MSSRCAKASDIATARDANKTIWKQKKRNSSIGDPASQLNGASCIKFQFIRCRQGRRVDILLKCGGTPDAHARAGIGPGARIERSEIRPFWRELRSPRVSLRSTRATYRREVWKAVGRPGTPRLAFVTIGASQPNCEDIRSKHSP